MFRLQVGSKVRGSLIFQVNIATQAIQVKADLYEMTEFDLLRMATALNEQSFKLLMSVLKKKAEEIEQKRIVSETIRLKEGMEKKK